MIKINGSKLLVNRSMSQNLASKLTKLGVTLSLSLTFVSLIAPLPALSQEKLLRTLNVTGRGVESIDTTLTQVELGVESTGKSASAVQQEVARRSTAVVELLKNRKVEKLETTGINLSPTYDYTGGRQVLTGYSAINRVRFQVPIPQAGILLDQAVQSGASRIDGLSFKASDTAIATAQQQALREATQDALQQARTVFSSLNITQKEIISIQINQATPPPSVPMVYATAARMKTGFDSTTPVIGGEQTVEATVTLTISY